jgi:hypothetical protein
LARYYSIAPRGAAMASGEALVGRRYARGCRLDARNGVADFTHHDGGGIIQWTKTQRKKDCA